MARAIKPLFGVLVAAVIAAPVSAQMQSLDDLTSLTSPPTTQQTQRIEGFTTRLTSELDGGDVDAVTAAADRLIAPAKSPITSSFFRIAYSSALIPKLKPIITRQAADLEQNFSAVQAVRVLGSLGTRNALELLVERLDSQLEKRWEVRLWAAKGCGTSLTQVLRDGSVREAQLRSIVRNISDSVQGEDHWLVALRKIESMANVRTEYSRTAQINALESVIDRVVAAIAQPSVHMRTVCLALGSYRAQYFDPNLDMPDVEAFGKALAPQLTRIYAAADAQWDAVQNESDAEGLYSHKLSYGRAIAQTDSLLSSIERALEASSGPRLSSSWRSGDHGNFSSGVQTWSSLVSKAPYKAP